MPGTHISLLLLVTAVILTNAHPLTNPQVIRQSSNCVVKNNQNCCQVSRDCSTCSNKWNCIGRLIFGQWCWGEWRSELECNSKTCQDEKCTDLEKQDDDDDDDDNNEDMMSPPPIVTVILPNSVAPSPTQTNQVAPSASASPSAETQVVPDPSSAPTPTNVTVPSPSSSKAAMPDPSSAPTKVPAPSPSSSSEAVADPSSTPTPVPPTPSSSSSEVAPEPSSTPSEAAATPSSSTVPEPIPSSSSVPEPTPSSSSEPEPSPSSSSVPEPTPSSSSVPEPSPSSSSVPEPTPTTSSAASPSASPTSSPSSSSSAESPTPSPSTPDSTSTLPGGNIECSCAQGQRVRKEFGSMSNTEWTTFVDTFKALKDTNDGRSTFEQFVDIHRLNRLEAHNTAQFLVWHREYLFQIECRMRAINPSVTFPYWDWSIDSNDPPLSPVWDRMGGAVQNESIPNEPFKDWSSSVPSQHNVIRGFNAGTAESFEVELESAAMIQNFQNDASLTYSAFNDALETFHGAPHIAIGGLDAFGDMSLVARSPNDPIFFLHHAFIDKIWDEWQKLPGKRREYSGFHFGQAVSLTNTTTPFSVNIQAIFERDECVTYEQPTRSGVPAASRLLKRQRAMKRVATRQEGPGVVEAPKVVLPKDIPPALAEKAEDSPIIQDALAEADKKDKTKLAAAPANRVEAVAERIAKNHVMELWAEINGFPMEKVKLAQKIAVKEDPTIKYQEVETGNPPGGKEPPVALKE